MHIFVFAVIKYQVGFGIILFLKIKTHNIHEDPGRPPNFIIICYF